MTEPRGMTAAAPVRGPLAAAVARTDHLGGGPPRLLYADLDLAEREATRRALGTPAATDESLVLAAYARWGPAAADRLGGQFAFAVWDGDRRALVAIRDPLGLRPLFWAHRGAAVVVGGDIRAVLDAGGLPNEIDPDALAGVLLAPRLLDAAVTGRTCLRAVHELRAGHRLTVADGRARTERYWDPSAIPAQPFRSLDEVGEALRAALRAAVGEAVADVPPGALGSHLSPGIDAAAVLSFAAEACAEAGRPPPHAFTWSFRPGPDQADAYEFRRMRAVVDRWGLPFTFAPGSTDEDVRGLLLDAARDPVEMWASEQPTREAAHAAGVRVLLSGWGGDEGVSFDGRDLVSRYLLRTGRWGPVLAMALRDPRRTVRRARAGRLRRAQRARPTDVEALRAAALAGDVACFARPDLLAGASLEALPPPAPSAPRARMEHLLLEGHLGRRAAAWARAGAPYGLRYRYPLLDRRVLAVALGVPPALWLTRDGRQRWPLRAAGEGVVPEASRLGPKAEPVRMAEATARATALPGRIAPLVTPAAAGDRAAFVDVPRLRAALDALAQDVAAGPLPDYTARTAGLGATGYLALGDGLGVGPGDPLPAAFAG